jgi:hypothetical protein
MMARRTENRIVKVEKPLDVQVHTCDNCGIELTTSRDIYFGDERLVVEGEDKTWFKLWARLKSHDYPSGDGLDFCSRKCLVEWAQNPAHEPESLQMLSKEAQ